VFEVGSHVAASSYSSVHCGEARRIGRVEGPRMVRHETVQHHVLATLVRGVTASGTWSLEVFG
jgi:hypothetical protein